MSAEGARYYIAQAGMAATTGWTGIAASVGVVPAAIGAAAAGAVAGAVALERRRRNRKASRTGSTGARSGRPTGRSRIGRALDRMRGRPTGGKTGSNGRPTGKPTGRKTGSTGRPTNRPTGTGAKKSTGRPTGTGGKSSTGKTKKSTGTGSKTADRPTGTGTKKSTEKKNKTKTIDTGTKQSTNDKKENTTMSNSRMAYAPGTMTENAAAVGAAVGAIPWEEDAAGIVSAVHVLNDLHGALEIYSNTIRSIAQGLERPGLNPMISAAISEIAVNHAASANNTENVVRLIRNAHAADFERMQTDTTNALDRRTNMDNM